MIQVNCWDLLVDLEEVIRGPEFQFSYVNSYGDYVVKTGCTDQEIQLMDLLAERGVNGIPLVLGVSSDGRNTVCMTRVPGVNPGWSRQYRALCQPDLTTTQWLSLVDKVREINEAGVVHNDLHGMNWFMDGDDAYVIDWDQAELINRDNAVDDLDGLAFRYLRGEVNFDGTEKPSKIDFLELSEKLRLLRTGRNISWKLQRAYELVRDAGLRVFGGNS